MTNKTLTLLLQLIQADLKIWKLQFDIKGVILIFKQTVFINKGLNFEITSKLPQSEEYNWGCAGRIYCRVFFSKENLNR